MAYPEPIPELRGKNAREFLRRLESFELTSSQKRFLRGARDFYLKLRPKE